MRNLVRRYVTVQQRRAECGGVTEDDVNEIKQDVSAFRCELVEILRNSGMNTSTANAGAPGGGGGKKNRQKVSERNATSRVSSEADRISRCRSGG